MNQLNSRLEVISCDLSDCSKYLDADEFGPNLSDLEGLLKENTMAKTRPLTWTKIFANDEIHQLATELELPIDRLLQLNPQDKTIPIKAVNLFLLKAMNHKQVAEMLLNSQMATIPNTDTFFESRVYVQNRFCVDQIIYEQIGFAYEFLFKSLVSIEYKQFHKKHYITGLYEMLEDEEIMDELSKCAKDFQWNDIGEFINFIDATIKPDRRYFGYDDCHKLEDFIANRFSQWMPIGNHNKVGIKALLELFMEMYKLVEAKAKHVHNGWACFISKLEKIYPTRFQRLNQHWSK